MRLIAVQSYQKIGREVGAKRQDTIIHERFMYLYDRKIETRHREFSIRDVFDISYRRMGSHGGIMYLHTNQGVFPYLVNSDPSVFIKAFHSLDKSQV